MSNKYYCSDCETTFDERDMVAGVTFAVDDYRNSACPECRSENIFEVDDDELCPYCFCYHADGDDYRECAELLYSPFTAFKYIEDDIIFALGFMREHKMRLREYVLDEAREFVEFVCELEKKAKALISA